jgi:hypothetical protein
MSREEIINILRKEVDNYDYSLFHSDLEQADKEILQKKIDALDKAIEALEQEPCKDTISREQAIDAVSNLFEISEYPHPYPQGKPIRLRDIKEKLKHLPSIQPQPKTGHWIPVSERLPEIRQNVLCQCRGNNYSVLRLNHDSDWECVYPRTTYMQSFVIAWMPLPEPFEPQESEDKE